MCKFPKMNNLTAFWGENANCKNLLVNPPPPSEAGYPICEMSSRRQPNTGLGKWAAPVAEGVRVSVSEGVAVAVWVHVLVAVAGGGGRRAPLPHPARRRLPTIDH